MHMLKKTFLILVLSFAFFQKNSIAQIRCGEEIINELLKNTNINYQSELNKNKYALSQYLANKESNFEITVIPVVFHIMYSAADAQIGQQSNLSFAQIQSQLTVLNQDYSKMPGTKGFNNNPIGVDTRFRFVLATIDPFGNVTNGINRVVYAKSDNHVINSLDEIEMKRQTRWPTNKYLNIWVVKKIVTSDGRNVLGYCNVPETLTATQRDTLDGPVIGSRFVGSVDNKPAGESFYLDPTYRYGRTLTHELGHYFNLYHIWGRTSGSCGDDDLVQDTPPCKDPYYVCTPIVQCSGQQRMIQNYLDYTPDDCMNIFTAGQLLRMNAAMGTFTNRRLLTADSNLLNTGVISQFPDSLFFTKNTDTVIINQSQNVYDVTFDVKVVDKRGIAIPNYKTKVEISYQPTNGNLTLDSDTLSTNLLGTATYQIQTNATEGQYQLKLNNPNLKGSGATFTLVVTKPTDENNPFKIYPNPSTNNEPLTILKNIPQITEANITINDMSGRILMRKKSEFTNGTIQIDSTPFRIGIYTISIESGKYIKTFKWVKAF